MSLRPRAGAHKGNKLGGPSPPTLDAMYSSAAMGAMEQLVRNWVDVLSTPNAPREPVIPEIVRPDAYIEWGAKGSFEADFRQEAKSTKFAVILDDSLLQGEYREEGRTWEDFAMVNPEDSGQSIIITRTQEVALKGGKTPPSTPDNPNPKTPQIRFSFTNTGEDQAPFYSNSHGQPFQPVVTSPLEQVVEVNWGGGYILITALVLDRTPSVRVVLELVSPPTHETTGNSDFLKDVLSDGHQRESRWPGDGDHTMEHPAEWNPKERVAFGAQRLPDGYYGVTGDSKDHWYEAGGVQVCDTEGVPNLSDDRLKAILPDPPGSGPTITWKLDTELGALVTVENETLSGGDPGYVIHTPQKRLAQPQTFYDNYWHIPGAHPPQIQNFPRHIFVFRQRIGAWEEKYWAPWGIAVASIDVSGLLKYFMDYYTTQQAPISVLVYIDAGYVEEDRQPSCKLRWAQYRGRIEDEDSVAAILGEGLPYSDEEKDNVSPEALFNYTLIPNSDAEDRLVATQTISLPAGKGHLDQSQGPEQLFLWDRLKGGRPMFMR